MFPRTAPFPPARPALPPRTARLALPARAAALRLLLAALLAGALALGLSAQVAINTTGAPPQGNAMLDISHASRGLLVPRMTRFQRTSIPAPAPGLLVYQTDSITTDPRGFYYYDMQTAIGGWKHLAWGPAQWQLGGNTGTTTADFIGSLNDAPLVFRIAGYEHGRLAADGSLQLYYSAPPVGPTGLVHVEGAVKLNGGSLGATKGTIRYTPGPGNSRGKFEGQVQHTGDWFQIDNNFGERRHQESPVPGASCQLPTNDMNPLTNPRPWPVPGPTAGFGTLTGPDSPYYTVWEDSRKQYLFLGSDLNAAGICVGPDNPITAIAFNVATVGSGAGLIHFLRFRMKNTTATDATAYDNNGLVHFADPVPGPYAGANYGHHIGYSVNTGWNVHNYDGGGTGFTWTGGNLLIDAALDNQNWISPSIRSGTVQSYNTGYASMLSMYCDACGGSGNYTCFWQTVPTTPINGVPGPPGGTAEGWGWTGAWFMDATTDTRACDGSATNWQGGGLPSVRNSLPRVAFYAKYTGAGASYNLGSYMYANEGLMVGDAAWAASGTYPTNPFKGPGTLTAKRSVWSGTTLLNDYVFDLYYDGQARPEDAQAAANYVRTPLRELPNYVERERRLPTIDGRAEWERTGLFGVDKLGNQLWVTVEEQALYIQELNARMEALQQYLVEKKLQELEGK